MSGRVSTGALAGLGAGIVFGILMQIMIAPAAEGGQIPVIQLVSRVIGADSSAAGWIYHLVNSAIIGGLFGWIWGSRVHDVTDGLGWGALWGAIWLVLGGLILMPLTLGMPAFAPLTMPEMRGVAIGSTIGHLLYGLVLGATYARLSRSAHAVPLTGV